MNRQKDKKLFNDFIFKFLIIFCSIILFLYLMYSFNDSNLYIDYHKNNRYFALCFLCVSLLFI